MLKSRLIWQKDVRCRKKWELSCFKVRQNHRPGSETGQRQGKGAERMTPACRAVGGGPSGGQIIRIQFTRKDRSGTDIFYGAKSTRANAVAPVTEAS